jgi:hypothetical protein
VQPSSHAEIKSHKFETPFLSAIFPNVIPLNLPIYIYNFVIINVLLDYAVEFPVSLSAS